MGAHAFDDEPLVDVRLGVALALASGVLAPHLRYVTEEPYRTFCEGVVEDLLTFLGRGAVRVLGAGSPRGGNRPGRWPYIGLPDSGVLDRHR